MKRLLFALLIIPATLMAQENFPGKDVDLLKGKEVKVKPLVDILQKYGFRGFYTNEKMTKIYSKTDMYATKYESLIGKVFKVVDFLPYKDALDREKYKMKITNTETGDLYYEYDPSSEYDFPFETIGGIQMPAGYYCRVTDTIKDKFTGEVRYSTGWADGITFHKTVKNGVSTIYMSINNQGSTLNTGEKGVIILLANGKRIDRPGDAVDVKVSSGKGWTYSAFLALTPDEIKLLLENPITDTRLYIYDHEVKNGLKLIEYLKCIN